MIVKEIFIEAPVSIVYSFLTDPTKIVAWMGTEAELNPTAGGIFRIAMTASNVVRGTYLETIPESKVTFTWGFEGEGHELPAGATVVEITLKPEGAGTRLTLVHRELRADWEPDHDVGWDYCLSRLELAAKGHPTSSFDPPRSGSAN